MNWDIKYDHTMNDATQNPKLLAPIVCPRDTPIVCSGDILICSAGTASSQFCANRRVCINSKPIGTIDDTVPGVNFKQFGMCTLQPGQICNPIINKSWQTSSQNIKIDGCNAINTNSTLMCRIGGCISVQQAMQNDVLI
jgi:hypothetical protein